MDVLLVALEEAERHQPEGCMVLHAVRDAAGALVDFQWAWANPAGARALGHAAPESLRGRRLRELMPGSGLASRVDLLRDVVEAGRPAADSFQEGDVWLQGTAVPLRDGVLLRLRDITSALRLEEGVRETLDWVRSMLEATPDAFFTLDADWRITYVNHEAAALSGRSQEQLFRQILWQACPELLGTRMERELRRVASGAGHAIFEWRATPGRWHEVHAWGANGNVSIFGRDVTSRKQAEAERDVLLSREHSGRLEAEALVHERTRELMAARERLVQSEKLAMAGQLAAGVGHEINNPLSYVVGNLQFALEQLEPSRRRARCVKHGPARWARRWRPCARRRKAPSASAPPSATCRPSLERRSRNCRPWTCTRRWSSASPWRCRTCVTGPASRSAWARCPR
ncbi:PAS domain-containing protein [Myxococcus sp. MxC21-1]|uniref:PAS domain-containing protein n=1 Tax=Myxococcus sp. MxC21-1 TaxID=3041439 RepID=UPI002930FC53|nr:PAS domain-containing protein [Myxococcus sp. MxC21-1]WNZ62609.1 PAS domain-containing protein [Myxococcus sp. MxC21-1]